MQMEFDAKNDQEKRHNMVVNLAVNTCAKTVAILPAMISSIKYFLLSFFPFFFFFQ